MGKVLIYTSFLLMNGLKFGPVFAEMGLKCVIIRSLKAFAVRGWELNRILSLWDGDAGEEICEWKWVQVWV